MYGSVGKRRTLRGPCSGRAVLWAARVLRKSSRFGRSDQAHNPAAKNAAKDSGSSAHTSIQDRTRMMLFLDPLS
jgi:hypothetical protein